MDKKLIIVLGVFLTVALCVAALYSYDSNHEEIPFKSIGNPATQSHVLGSVMKNDDLIVTIETSEPVTVKPATIHHSVLLDDDVSTVTIYNYTGQIFHIVAGNTSGIHLFGALDKKEYDKENKTVTIINDTSKKSKMIIKLLSSEPDLTTFTEVFEVTNFEMYTPDLDLDYKARSVVHKGGNDVFKTEWFVEANQSYVVNITDYKTVQVKKEVHNNKTGKNETVFMNETVVSGYHGETHYHNVWSDYNKYGMKLAKNTVQKIKVVYHKKAELGNVRIQTVPVFCGIECDELTWWNTSWGKRVQRNVNNASVALTDYQLKNTTTYDSDMNANFSDLRFTNDTGTLIPYWIESKTDSSTAEIWLKIPSISTTTGATVWMYYNNSAANSVSSISDTFVFGDDFPSSSIDLTKWDGDTGSVSVSSGIATLVCSGIQYVHSDSSFAPDTILEARNKIPYTVWASWGMRLAPQQMTQYMDGTNNWFSAADSGTSEISTNWDTTNIYTRKKFIWADSANSVSFFENDIERTNSPLTVGANIPDESLNVVMGRGAGVTIYTDWIFLRKYTATEPTWAADCAEETVSLADLSITGYAPTTPITLELGTAQTFNVTTNITSSCKWYINGSLKQTNTTGATEHSYTNTSLEAGYWNFTAVVNTTTENASQTWWVTVCEAPSIPPDPTTLSSTTGNFWIRHDWQAGTGNITDGYNVSVNGTWYNTSNTFINLSKSPHGWQNITVLAWNASGACLGGPTQSTGNLSDNLQLPNNPMYITNYSTTYEIYEFDTIDIDFDYTDADGDTPTFATDSPRGSLNSGTGVWSWTTINDEGIYQWTFNVTDGYGSVAEASPYVTVLPDFGYDHGSADWTPTDGDMYDLDAGVGSIVIAGYHWNIDTFTIADGTSVSIKSFDDAGAHGYIFIKALSINVSGNLSGTNTGYAGGAGGAKGDINGSDGAVGVYAGTYAGTCCAGGIGAAGCYCSEVFPDCYPYAWGGSGGYTSGVSYIRGTVDGMDYDMGGGGSGGGGGGNGGYSPATNGGSGERGGGIIYLDASNIDISGRIDSDGGLGGAGGTGGIYNWYLEEWWTYIAGGYGGGGHGGSGGCILLIGNYVNMSGNMSASGGSSYGNGGLGGGGRIKIFYRTEYTSTDSVIEVSGCNDGSIYSGIITERVNINGTVYNASSMQPLDNATVNLLQASTNHNTITDAYGNYSISYLLPQIPINFDVSKVGYTHENFSVTPLWADNYTVDLYMMPEVTGVHGLVVDYPWHQAIHNSTVRLWNATYNTSASTNQAGYYLITGVNNSEYTMNASKAEYTASNNESITVVDNVSTQSFVLMTQYNLTITATDSSTGAPLTSFAATVEDETISTTTGSAVYTLDYGLYYVTVASNGYYSSSVYAFLDEDESLELELTPTASQYYAPHNVKFTVMFEGATCEGVEVTANCTTGAMDKITGTDGAVVFEMTETTRYTMTFIHTGHGIDETRVLYPIGNHYYIYINESYTYDPGNVSTELTNYSTTNTSRDWAIHNLTSHDLNSTIGLGMLGQGIVASTAIWVIVGAGGPATAFAAIAAMAALGIVTWILALFCGMTTVALYILGGKIR